MEKRRHWAARRSRPASSANHETNRLYRAKSNGARVSGTRQSGFLHAEQNSNSRRSAHDNDIFSRKSLDWPQHE
jgi:hypothetical protein